MYRYPLHFRWDNQGSQIKREGTKAIQRIQCILMQKLLILSFRDLDVLYWLVRLFELTLGELTLGFRLPNCTNPGENLGFRTLVADTCMIHRTMIQRTS